MVPINTTMSDVQDGQVAVKRAKDAELQARARVARVEEDLETVQAESQDASVTGIRREEIVMRIQTCQDAEAGAQADVTAAAQVRSSPPQLGGPQLVVG